MTRLPHAIALVALCGACRPEPQRPDLPGPYNIGATTRDFVDARGKALRMEVWYPTEESGAPGPYEELDFTMNAIRDAEPADGPFPLVAFSHGSVSIRFQSAFMTEHLASHGFVVVAPDHPDNTLLDVDPRPETMARVMLERPDDVRSAVDDMIGLSEGGRLPGLIDPDAGYAVMGHSFGALTSLVVGGGRPDVGAAVAYCQTNDEPQACDIVTEEMAAQLDQHGAADDRVVATVAMSPFAWYAFEGQGDGLDSVRQPLVLGGGRDSVTPYDTEIQPVFDALAAPKTLMAFPDAAHYSFSDICFLAPLLFPECDPEAGFADLETVQRQSNLLVTAYLKVHLEGDDRFEEWLSEGLWDGIDGVDYTIR
jgi:predicted dienelactone hydrolase